MSHVNLRPGDAVLPEFPSCVITRAQRRRHAVNKNDEDSTASVDLTDSLFFQLFTDDGVAAPMLESPASNSVEKAAGSRSAVTTISREAFIAGQRKDPSLRKYFVLVDKPPPVPGAAVFSIVNGVLVRKWLPRAPGKLSWGMVNQVVVPSKYRQEVLSQAHESPWAGHVGINKTYNLSLRHSFWPG